MTALADKLKDAGYDTFEAKFAVLAAEALRHHPHSVVDAWRFIGAQFGYEYLRERMKDMRGGEADKEKSPPTPLGNANPAIGTPNRKPFEPPPKPWKPDPAKLKKAKEEIKEILFGYRISDGRDIGEVGAHELVRFVRDGKLMDEIQKELPVLTGNLKFANLGQLITVKQFKNAQERAGV